MTAGSKVTVSTAFARKEIGAEEEVIRERWGGTARRFLRMPAASGGA